MTDNLQFWRWYGLPICLALVSLTGLNALWMHTFLYQVIDYTLVVYLFAGSGLALLLVARDLHAGRVDATALGLGLSGWTAPKRVFGMLIIVTLMIGGGYYTLQPVPVSPSVAGVTAVVQSGSPNGVASYSAATAVAGGYSFPSWGHYCFWWLVLLSASLAELTVFISVTYCFLEESMKRRGYGAVPAFVISAIVSSVTFGLYHYSHEQTWWAYVYTLMPVMLCNLIFFVITRNFYLTLLVHNSFAATGFTSVFGADPLSLVGFSNPKTLATNVLSFLVPFLLLHWLEWRNQPRPVPPQPKARASYSPKEEFPVG